MGLDINNYEPAFKYGAQLQTDDIAASAVTGVKGSMGTQYITIVGSTPVNSMTATSVIGAFPVAGTITSVSIIPLNNIACVWELSSVTNTKALVVARVNNTASANFVVGASSILNAGVAAGENLFWGNSLINNASATVVITFATPN